MGERPYVVAFSHRCKFLKTFIRTGFFSLLSILCVLLVCSCEVLAVVSYIEKGEGILEIALIHS